MLGARLLAEKWFLWLAKMFTVGHKDSTVVQRRRKVIESEIAGDRCVLDRDKSE
jgi:hypothetical protein